MKAVLSTSHLYLQDTISYVSELNTFLHFITKFKFTVIKPLINKTFHPYKEKLLVIPMSAEG